jgi:ketosteroid isomerase-like protein
VTGASDPGAPIGAAGRSANEALVRRFYAALAARDATAMGACYADDATFSDPVFPSLDAAGVRAMWAMLCARGKDLAVELADVEAGDGSASARWIARYTFAATGRRVENRIDTSFALRDGRIVRQTDRFDLWRWSRQALGLAGLLLGWSPLVSRSVRRQAADALAAWRARTPG